MLARALITALLIALPAQAQVPFVPVMVGGDPDLDACGGWGEVGGLNPRGDGFLAVRAGPSTDYVKIDELYNGDGIHLCTKEGRWWGIVYGQGACGVDTPRLYQAYSGPCRSGWVYDRWVRQIAG